MKNKELTVDITARLTVSDEMADRCLLLLEWWAKDHPEQKIMETSNKDGSLHLYRESTHDTETGD